MTKTRQRDGSFNVVVICRHADGDQQFVSNVKDPDAYYADKRHQVDNPIVRDLEAEKEVLLKEREMIDLRIAVVDTEITERDTIVVIKER